jgi:hypothetical protein
MDPWEIATITILVVIVAVAAGVGIKSMNTGSVGAIAGTFFFAVTNFIPFGLLTFGLIADMIGQEFRYTIGSLVGIFSIIGNYLLKFVLEPFMAIPPAVATTGDSGKAWCMIPGLEGLENRVTPMNFVSSTAIMTYYLIFAALNRNTSQNISIYSMFPLILVLQVITFYIGSCDQYYPAGWAGKLGAVVLGVIFGSTGYGLVSSLYPASSPFGYGIKNPVNPSASGWQGAREPTPGIGGPQTGAKCSAANTDDDNAYVCEAYKNGVLVTEKIS